MYPTFVGKMLRGIDLLLNKLTGIGGEEVLRLLVALWINYRFKWVL